MKEHEAAIKRILTPSQFLRLGQIALQMRGLEAFREPEVVAALGLTPDQRAQINEIDGFSGGRFGPWSRPPADRGGPDRGRDGPDGHGPGEPGRGFNERMPGGPDGPRGKPDPGRERPGQKKNDSGTGIGPKKREDSSDRQSPMVRVLKILTPDQLARWQELIGKPFEWKEGNPGRMQKRGP